MVCIVDGDYRLHLLISRLIFRVWPHRKQARNYGTMLVFGVDYCYF